MGGRVNNVLAIIGLEYDQNPVNFGRGMCKYREPKVTNFYKQKGTNFA